jgi:hypothetical protein
LCSFLLLVTHSPSFVNFAIGFRWCQGALDELNGGGGNARRRSGREEISTGAEEPRLNSVVVEAVRVGEVAGRRFPLAPRSAGSV